MLLLDYITLKI
jgi:hypothetical protein